MLIELICGQVREGRIVLEEHKRNQESSRNNSKLLTSLMKCAADGTIPGIYGRLVSRDGGGDGGLWWDVVVLVVVVVVLRSRSNSKLLTYLVNRWWKKEGDGGGVGGGELVVVVLVSVLNMVVLAVIKGLAGFKIV